MVDDKAILPAGRPAPDFVLPRSPTQALRLSQFSGSPVVLTFYPADWSPVCGDQMTLYEAVRSEIERDGARLLGVSVDGVWCHRAFAEARGIGFPLLADFEPKGGVARMYGAYDERAGVAGRALFVLDADGTVAWSHLSPPEVNPGADGILAALARLETGGQRA
jgi:peroxiredoxin